jgi:hypothetical protein
VSLALGLWWYLDISTADLETSRSLGVERAGNPKQSHPFPTRALLALRKCSQEMRLTGVITGMEANALFSWSDGAGKGIDLKGTALEGNVLVRATFHILKGHYH